MGAAQVKSEEWKVKSSAVQVKSEKWRVKSEADATHANGQRLMANGLNNG